MGTETTGQIRRLVEEAQRQKAPSSVGRSGQAAHLLDLFRRAVRAIRLNLAFSVGVLVVAVVLAAVGVINPMTRALLHELSSLPVIANAAPPIGVREQGSLG